MLFSNTRILGMVVVGLVGTAAQAQAQETNVTTAAASAKVGAELRGEWIYNDNGLEKTKGADAKATSDIAVSTANIVLSGKINPATDYLFKFSVLGGGLSEGYGRHSLNDAFAFSIGRQKVLQGGFDNIESDFTAHLGGAYGSNLVFNEFEDMVAFHVQAGGDLTVQILNDKIGSWNTKKKQTFIVGWTNTFNTISPIINVGSYDNNKSTFFDVGVKTEVAGVAASLDVYMKQDSEKAVTADGKNKELKDTSTSYSVNLSYEIKGVMTPWFYYSVFDRKEATDSAIAGREKETKTNTINDEVDANGNVIATERLWDDNGVTWGVGAHFEGFGQGWTPFVAVIGESGKWMEGGKEETKSNTTVKIGVLGEI